jgi:hypothetical protein
MPKCATVAKPTFTLFNPWKVRGSAREIACGRYRAYGARGRTIAGAGRRRRLGRSICVGIRNPAGKRGGRGDLPAGSVGRSGLRLIRRLRSDYALTFVSDREEWIGYRDTFEVDGRPVRAHDDRLMRLLTRGALTQAVRINEENARYNLVSDRFVRTVNHRPSLWSCFSPVTVTVSPHGGPAGLHSGTASAGYSNSVNAAGQRSSAHRKDATRSQ